MNKYDEEYNTPSLLDEFREFLIELWELLKKDFRNSIQVISSNKSFFTTAVLLAILLQVSSVSNLGASFEKYCGSSREYITQQGGDGGEPQVLSYQDYKQVKAQTKAFHQTQAKQLQKEQKLELKIQNKISKKSAGLADRMMSENKKRRPSANGSTKSIEQYQAEAEQTIRKKAIDKAKGKEDKSALSKGRSASIADYKTGVDEARDADKEMKANEERLSFFEGIKKKFNSTGSMGGPLFGRLDLIFDSVKNIFYIIAIILTIVGVLSLPVLVFLIITYYVFKTMISKFIIL